MYYNNEARDLLLSDRDRSKDKNGGKKKSGRGWALRVFLLAVVLSALLTTLGLYQKLAAKAGAGTLVPITGFANAVVSAAIEFKAEGRVLGTGAKMFTIAGPVIVYGTLAAVVYGVVLWLLRASAL